METQVPRRAQYLLGRPSCGMAAQVRNVNRYTYQCRVCSRWFDQLRPGQVADDESRHARWRDDLGGPSDGTVGGNSQIFYSDTAATPPTVPTAAHQPSTSRVLAAAGCCRSRVPSRCTRCYRHGADARGLYGGESVSFESLESAGRSAAASAAVASPAVASAALAAPHSSALHATLRATSAAASGAAAPCPSASHATTAARASAALTVAFATASNAATPHTAAALVTSGPAASFSG